MEKKLKEALAFKIAYGILFLAIMGLYFYKLLIVGETNTDLLIVLCVGVLSFWVGKIVASIKS